jgi:ATP-dependent DNA helicase DinG
VRQSAYGEVIPDCALAVIDEAHQLEDVATQYFGLSVSNYRLDELARDGERVLKEVGTAVELIRLKDLAATLDRIRERSRQFFTALGAGRSSEGGRPEERQRITARSLEPAAEPGQRLVAALETLDGAIHLLKEGTEDLAGLARRARGVADDLSFLLKASDPDYVYFLEARGRGVFLKAAPIDVSGIIRRSLLDRFDALVLTSATLTVDGTFDYFKGRLGLSGAGTLAVPGEFDYASQAILYLPRPLPDPRSPSFAGAAAREIVEILTRTEGRAFVLFTSYATLRDVYVLAARSLTYPILVQGTAPRSVLLREFRETPHSVLLATSSFWQGVDVIGDALSCVIIDKLPFASPSDPVTAARIEALASRGEDAFNGYQVPLAILTLLQGLGRLIRHRQDRGVLSVLDPRIQTKGYGRRFLASLPPAPVTRDLDAIRRFFRATAPGAGQGTQPPAPASCDDGNSRRVDQGSRRHP